MKRILALPLALSLGLSALTSRLSAQVSLPWRNLSAIPSPTITATGDATGTVTLSPTAGASLALTLSNTTVSAGTYRSLTVDAKGRVTAATNPTTFAGYGLSDTSANLAAAIADETGSGALVFGTSPLITTPTINTITAASSNDMLLSGGGGGAQLLLGRGASGAASVNRVVYAGSAVATSGADVIRGTYSAAESLLTLGTLHGSGAAFLGYGVRADPSTDNGFLSSTSIAVARGAVVTGQNEVKFFGGALQTSTEGGAVSIAEKARLSTAGNILIGGTTDIAGTGGLKVFGNAAPTNTTSGAFQVVGGGGFGGSVYVGGKGVFNSTAITAATSDALLLNGSNANLRITSANSSTARSFRATIGTGVSILSDNYQPYSPVTQDDAGLPSWMIKLGGGVGGDLFDIERSPAGSTTMTPLFTLSSAGNASFAGSIASGAGGSITGADFSVSSNINTPAVQSGSTTGTLRLGGGSGQGNSANIILYGGSHATKPNVTEIVRNGSTVTATFAGDGTVSIPASTASTSNSTGALVVGNGTSGGLGVGGAINAGGNIAVGANGTVTSAAGQLVLVPGGVGSSLLLRGGSGGTVQISGNTYCGSDDTYFSWDASGNSRLGFIKKASFLPKLAHGSGTAFAIARSSGGSIDVANTFSDELVIDTSGNVAVIAATDATPAGAGSLATAGGVYAAKKVISGGGEQIGGSGGTLMTKVRHGTATLVAGAATVSDTAVTANTRIFLTSQSDGGTPGWLRVSARTASTSFTITSSSATDTSTVAYLEIEP